MPRGKVVMGAMTAAEVKESERKMGFAEKQLKGRRGAKGSTRYEDDEADEEIIGKIEAAPAAAAAAKKGNVFSSDDSSDDSSGLEEEDQKPATKKVVQRKTPLKKDMTYEFDPDDDRDDASVPGEEGTVEVDPIQLPLTGKPTDFDKDSESDEEEPVFLSRATSTDKEMKAEAGRLFLFKLPTRLPSLESQGVETQVRDARSRSERTSISLSTNTSPPPPKNLGDAALDIAAITGAANPSASSDADADPGRPKPDDRRLFDESLSKMTGQLGRIDVYEDGSAELVITGADGRETRMDVDHGIECGFKQTAVWIDAGERGYREVGDIDKGIVVTPQLE